MNIQNIIYVTGNEHKARYFAEILNMNIQHMKINVDEIQSLDVREIVAHKAKSAYKIVKKPVIVEDTWLTFHAMGALPGPLIKWFLDELGANGLCKMLDAYSDRSATAGATFAYYDGKELKIFESELCGNISSKPTANDDGFGWNTIFIPDRSKQTLAEMDDETFKSYYNKIKPLDELKSYLENGIN